MLTCYGIAVDESCVYLNNLHISSLTPSIRIGLLYDGHRSTATSRWKHTQATAKYLGVDAQLLQAAIYRLAGDQNVARHKRACMNMHPTNASLAHRYPSKCCSWARTDVVTRQSANCGSTEIWSTRGKRPLHFLTFYYHLRNSPCSASEYAAYHVYLSLTHFYMPLSNHRYKYTGGHAAYCSPFVPQPPRSRDARRCTLEN
jgi:hypothetical protein